MDDQDAQTATCQAAKARAIVRLPDGRTGRLVYWPGRHRGRQGGRRPKIMPPTGAFITVEPDVKVVVVEGDQ